MSFFTSNGNNAPMTNWTNGSQVANSNGSIVRKIKNHTQFYAYLEECTQYLVDDNINKVSWDQSDVPPVRIFGICQRNEDESLCNAGDIFSSVSNSNPRTFHLLSMQYMDDGSLFYVIRVRDTVTGVASTESLTMDIPNAIQFQYDASVFEQNEDRVGRINELWNIFIHGQSIAMPEGAKELFVTLLNGEYDDDSIDRKVLQNLLSVTTVHGQTLLYFVLMGMQCGPTLINQLAQVREDMFRDSAIWINTPFNPLLMNTHDKYDVDMSSAVTLLGFCLDGFSSDVFLHQALARLGCQNDPINALDATLNLLTSDVGTKAFSSIRSVFDFLSTDWASEFLRVVRAMGLDESLANLANLNSPANNANDTASALKATLQKLQARLQTLKQKSSDVFIDAQVTRDPQTGEFVMYMHQTA